MTFWPLVPMPRMKRPSLISSSVAAVIARTPGERLNTFTMPVPSLMRFVFTAISASRVKTSYPHPSGIQKES
jgi:hypothetical protein